MKKAGILIIIVAMLGVVGSCTSFSKEVKLKTEIDTMSYYFGMAQTDGIMNYLVMQLGIDTAYMDAFYKGYKEGAKNYGPKETAYLEGMRIAHMINNQWIEGVNSDIFMGAPDKTINREAVIAGFYHGVKNPNEYNLMHAQSYSRTKMEEIKSEYTREIYADKIAEGEKFLAENKNKEGVKTTPSGLQYKILVEGKGAIPEEASIVKVNYRGTLIDGTEFDSSFKNNEPSSFPVNRVIPGWIEALQMMPVGSKWELFVPQDIGYGYLERPGIPPYSTLLFEIELLEIEQ